MRGRPIHDQQTASGCCYEICKRALGNDTRYIKGRKGLTHYLVKVLLRHLSSLTTASHATSKKAIACPRLRWHRHIAIYGTATVRTRHAMARAIWRRC
jgi:hypothetical protein